jgi:hypothetical protein
MARSEGYPVNDFLKLMAEAEEPKPPEAGSFAIEAVDDPDRMARVVIKRIFTNADGVLTLRKLSEDYFEYERGVYRRRPDDEIKSAVHRAVKAEFDARNCELQKRWTGEGDPPAAHKVSRALISNVMGAMDSKIILPETTRRSAWIGPPLTSGKNIIAMGNGLLDVDALLAHQSKVLHAHTPADRLQGAGYVDLGKDTLVQDKTVRNAILVVEFTDDGIRAIAVGRGVGRAGHLDRCEGELGERRCGNGQGQTEYQGCEHSLSRHR